MRTYVFIILALLLFVPVTARYLPEKCITVEPTVTCTDFAADWGTDGTDGTLSVAFQSYGNDTVAQHLVAKDDGWECVLAGDPIPSGSWGEFNGTCDFTNYEGRLRVEISDDDEPFATASLRISGSPSYPRPTIWEEISFVLPLLLLLLPYIASVMLCWVMILRWKKRYRRIAWWSLAMMGFLIVLFLLGQVWWLQRFVPGALITLDFLILPSSLALTAGILAYRKKREPFLFIPIFVGGLGVLLSLAWAVFLVFLLSTSVTV